MRMSVALDEGLIGEAQRLSKRKTKGEVIDEALREFIRMKRREDAIKHAGNIRIDITLKELHSLREKL